jgi:deoxyribonuclease V
MRFAQNHPWDVTPKQASDIQRRLRSALEQRDRLSTVRRVAGVDVGFKQGGSITRAAVAVLSFPALNLLEYKVVEQPTRFPYVPGLLSFRELPAVLSALSGLTQLPDLILCDGQGYAHPRRFGLACHLGVLLDIPCIGAAKSRLIGCHGVLPPEKGRWVPLTDGEETIGAVLRTRDRVRPLYVSIGHRICLATAVDYVLACCPRYRLPETTRQAHRLASMA